MFLELPLNMFHKPTLENIPPNSFLKFIFFILIVLFTHPLLAQLFVATNVYIDQGAKMHVAVNQTTFEKSHITTARGVNYGILSFGVNANWEMADHNAYVNGTVRIYDKNSFQFPVGDNNIIQPIKISGIEKNSSTDVSFVHTKHSQLEKEENIKQLSEEFYWTLSGADFAKIALSWSAFSNIDVLTNNDIEKLGIAGFDGAIWRIIEAELDAVSFYDGTSTTVLSGSISSKNEINLNEFKSLTLIALEENKEELVFISQGFTPNGDGINDTWHIDNIASYPNAEIHLYNRWGREVFVSLGNYQNDWNGTFKNYSEPVPDGSYAYTIDLDGDGQYDLSGWVYITR